MYLAGKLDALARSSSVSHHPTAGERPPGERRRRTYEYAVSGARVCVAVFLFAHNCSRYLLHKIEAHLAAGCIGFTEHGGTGKAPWNVIPEEEMQAVLSFIEGYANRYGLPQPAAPRCHNKPAPTYLPCLTTKVLLHGEYVEAGGKLSYVSIIRVWKSKCTSVVIMKPERMCVEHALIYNLEVCAPGQRRIEWTQPSSFTRISQRLLTLVISTAPVLP